MYFTENPNLDQQQKEALYQLWNKEYPMKLAYEHIGDFEKYLDDLSQIHHCLLYDDNHNIKGWAFTFDRENERWFAIILSGEIQGKGYGNILLNRLKEKNTSLSGWVIDHQNDLKSDGQPYRSPKEFYLKCGYKLLPHVRLETTKISAVKVVWIQD